MNVNGVLPPSPTKHDVLVLDAMGVIYRVGDDVADLLVPFVREKGGVENEGAIEAAYRAASLGQFAAREFWRRVGLSAAIEDEYLSRFELSEGVLDVLQQAPSRFQAVVCLSNDLSEWSRKLRHRFRLEQHFTNWYISGDLQLRKPDPQIYAHLLADLDIPAARIVFVDDRVKNLDPAAELGLITIHYHPDAVGPDSRHRIIHRLSALMD